jgi:hypothetical protein
MLQIRPWRLYTEGRRESRHAETRDYRSSVPIESISRKTSGFGLPARIQGEGISHARGR